MAVRCARRSLPHFPLYAKSGGHSPGMNSQAALSSVLDSRVFGFPGQTNVAGHLSEHSEANVHVSIANWVKTQDEALLPKNRRLWFVTDQDRHLSTASGKAKAKTFDLAARDTDYINSLVSG